MVAIISERPLCEFFDELQQSCSAVVTMNVAPGKPFDASLVSEFSTSQVYSKFIGVILMDYSNREAPW